MQEEQLLKAVSIEKLVFKGFGLGHAEGHTIFVINAVPEDIVDVRVMHRKKGILIGRIENFIQTSPHRIDPGCEVFGECGGCDWLNLPYEIQILFKQQVIESFFNEFGRIYPIIAAEEPFNYRNKSFLPVSVDGIGMYARMSHTVVPHKDCRIQPEVFDRVVTVFSNYMTAAKATPYNENTHTGCVRHIGIRYSISRGEFVVIIVTRNAKLPFTKQLVRQMTIDFPQMVGIVQNINRSPGNTILGPDEKILWGRAHIFEDIGSRAFKINYRSFFQINSQQTHTLYSYIRDKTGKNKCVIDAYSGIGSIGLYISEKAEKVFCIERNASACRDAEENAAQNNITNCEFIEANVEDAIPKLVEQHDIDAIIFDPPRRGLDADIIEHVQGIPKIIYISCNPSTQVRDIRMLMKKGYRLKRVQPFDMFPQTYHIENVAILEKGDE